MYRCENFVKSGFESVRDLLYQSLEDSGSSCAQLCVYVGSEVIIDWCVSTGNKYNHESLQLVFSSSKVMTSLALAFLIEDGRLKYSDKVSDIWPEFGQSGKHSITVADVMRHQAGLTRVNSDFDLLDFLPENLHKNYAGKALETQLLNASHIDHDGSIRRHYHYFTRGYLVNEIIRRVDGRTLGQLLKDKFRDTNVDAYVGLKPEDSDQWYRICQLLIPTWKQIGVKVWKNFWPLVKIVKSMFWCYPYNVLIPRINAGIATFSDYFPNLNLMTACPATITDPETKKRYILAPWNLEFYLNSDYYKMAEQPGANGIASGRGLAKIAAFMANKGQLNGQRLVTEGTWKAMHDKEVVEPELELGGMRTQFSQGGLNHFVDYDDDQQMEKRFKRGRNGFWGWLGFGGSVCQYNPELKIGFGFAPLDFLYYDFSNSIASSLQEEVVKCVRNQNS